MIAGGAVIAVSNAAAAHPMQAIRNLDYTILFVRDMTSMRAFYSGVMRFPLIRELSADWVEYRVGSNVLALATPGLIVKDATPPKGVAAAQLAFRVKAAEVDACATALATDGVAILSPPTNQAWGHRTLFFRDPDGNLLEIYADI